jgi:hypothetical protein
MSLNAEEYDVDGRGAYDEHEIASQAGKGPRGRPKGSKNKDASVKAIIQKILGHRLGDNSGRRGKPSAVDRIRRAKLEIIHLNQALERMEDLINEATKLKHEREEIVRSGEAEGLAEDVELDGAMTDDELLDEGHDDPTARRAKRARTGSAAGTGELTQLAATLIMNSSPHLAEPASAYNNMILGTAAAGTRGRSTRGKD